MRRSLSSALVAVALLGAAACGSSSSGSSSAGSSSAGTTPAAGGSSSSGPPVKVTVGVIPIIDVAPIYLGKSKGFFTSRGLDLNLQLAQGGAAIVPAVLSGQTQFGFSNVVSMLVADSKGLPIKLVAPGVSSTGVQGADFQGIAVTGNGGIQTAKDLEGKTVGVNTLQNICGVSINASVRKAGGDPSKVKYVEIAAPDAPAALADGRIAADCMGEPFLSVVKKRGDRVVASNYVDVADNATIAAYFTSDKLIKSDPGLVSRFTAGIKESLAYADSHPDEARAAVSTYTNLTADQVSGVTLPKWPAEFNTASLQTIAQDAVTDKLITKTPDLTALLPTR